MRKIAIITGSYALCACATVGAGAFQNTFVEMTETPEFILETLAELHEAKLGEKTAIRLFLSYSYAEPDQQSYLQVRDVFDLPGVDAVAVFDLEANLGKQLLVTGVAVKDDKTLAVVTKDESILIKIDGLVAASQ